MTNFNGFLVQSSHEKKGVNFAVYNLEFRKLAQSLSVNLLAERLPKARKAQLAGITSLDTLEKLTQEQFDERHTAHLQATGALSVVPESEEVEEDSEPTLEEVATFVRRMIRNGVTKGKIVASRNGQPGTITFETPARPAPQKVVEGGEDVGTVASDTSEPIEVTADTQQDTPAAAEAA